MSNFVLMAIFDHAVKEFAPCMCVQTEQVGMRAFIREINRAHPDNLLSTNKEDFTLYLVGEYSTDDGTVITRDPRVVLHGRDVVIQAVPAVATEESYGGTAD